MKAKQVFAGLAVLVMFCCIAPAQDSGPGLDSYIESLRADARADKTAIVTQAMALNDQDGKIFWPIYRKYEADLTKLNDQRIALIKSYAEKYPSLSDADAKSMIDQSLDFEKKRVALHEKYAKEFQKGGLSSLTTAKFMQLEHRLDLLIDLQIASQLPPIMNKPVAAAGEQK
jgi:hypothetical protein